MHLLDLRKDGKMKRLIILMMVFILVLGIAGCSGNSSEEERPLVTNAAAATFAYIEDIDQGYKVITSEVSSLYTFDDLALIPADDNSTFDWIYRIVFNPAEIVKDGEEITVLFGEEAISINGVNYVAANETDYSDILEWAANKYDFFDYALQPSA